MNKLNKNIFEEQIYLITIKMFLYNIKNITIFINIIL
jgi:hypothetical protein